MENESQLARCPFCGAPAEPSTPIKPTLEEAMESKPYINCSRPKCAGRHVCASISEWQYRTTAHSPAVRALVEAVDKIIEEHPTSGDHAEDGRYCLNERMQALYALAEKYDLIEKPNAAVERESASAGRGEGK